MNQINEEKFDRKTLVIFPGAFHIFSPGHYNVCKSLEKRFPYADLFVSSTNRMEQRPFSFKEKQFLASCAGVPSDKFIEVTNPYKCKEITSKYDSKNTILIFALSSKDKERLANPIKKDGSLSYIQPLPSGATHIESMNKHAYYVVIPAITYEIMGNEINSAKQIREMYSNGNETIRYQIIRELYPYSTKVGKIKEILDRVLNNSKKIDESVFYPNGYDKPSKTVIHRSYRWIWSSETGPIIFLTTHGTHADMMYENGLSYDDNPSGYIYIGNKIITIVGGGCGAVEDTDAMDAVIQELLYLYPQLKDYKIDADLEGYCGLYKESNITEHIVKLKNGKYRLLSHKGKNLGTFDSHKAAAKHEGEVEYFKSLKESKIDDMITILSIVKNYIKYL